MASLKLASMAPAGVEMLREHVAGFFTRVKSD